MENNVSESFPALIATCFSLLTFSESSICLALCSSQLANILCLHKHTISNIGDTANKKLINTVSSVHVVLTIPPP